MNKKSLFFAFNDSTANTQAIAENWMEDDEWLARENANKYGLIIIDEYPPSKSGEEVKNIMETRRRED